MYKPRQERPYRPPLPGSDSRRGSMVPAFARKNCRVRHPALFRGNWCGLRESPRRRNALRFYCPARSNEGAGGTGQDILVERNCLRDAASDDARRGAQGGPGAAAPGAFWGLLTARKSPPPEAAPAGAATAAATRGRFAARTRDARYLRSVRLVWACSESGVQHGRPYRPPLRRGRGAAEGAGWRADVGIGPYGVPASPAPRRRQRPGAFHNPPAGGTNGTAPA